MVDPAEPRPVVLGLLGGIAAGKSTVARVLAEQGALVLDADREVRALLATPEIQRALERRFGPAVLAAGVVDRAALAGLVFRDGEALAWLEGLLHPRVQARMEAALSRALSDATVPAVVLDVPLLLERSPLKKRCDQLIFVDCEADIRRKRAEKLRGWTAEEFQRRESHQWSPETKQQQADVVFHNHSDEASLRQAVLDWLTRSGGFAGLPRDAGQAPPGPMHERTPRLPPDP